MTFSRQPQVCIPRGSPTDSAEEPEIMAFESSTPAAARPQKNNGENERRKASVLAASVRGSAQQLNSRFFLTEFGGIHDSPLSGNTRSRVELRRTSVLPPGQASVDVRQQVLILKDLSHGQVHRVGQEVRGR